MDKWTELCGVVGIKMSCKNLTCVFFDHGNCGTCTDEDKRIELPTLTAKKVLSLEELILLSFPTFSEELRFKITDNQPDTYTCGYSYNDFYYKAETRPEALSALLVKLIAADVITKEQVKEVINAG